MLIYNLYMITFMVVRKMLHRILFYMTGIIIIMSVFCSCNPTKKVPEGSYLLDHNYLMDDNEKLNKPELIKIIKQKPNKKILGAKFHLMLYNQASEKKNTHFSRWLKRIGEEPVIYDDFQSKRTIQQLKLYMKNKGYYQAVVTDSVKYKNKKANVFYKIKSFEPYRIGKIDYTFEDSAMKKLIHADTLTLLKSGNLFDMDVLQNERVRIEELMKNAGYYYFNKEFVYYIVDSSFENNNVNITLGITNYVFRDTTNNTYTGKHKLCRIRNVYINILNNSKKGSADSSSVIPDTIKINNLFFIYQGEEKYKHHVISQFIFILPTTLYNQTLVDETYRSLNALKNFKSINIDFKKSAKISDTTDTVTELDCIIRLTPYVFQSFQVELEGTNSSGNFGADFNIVYQYKNLFKKAQILDFKVKGAFETLKLNQSLTSGMLFYNAYEFGSELRWNIPQFFIPFRSEQFIKEYNPKTNFILGYNYQKRPDYTRTISTAIFGYTWNTSKKSSFVFNPVELNYVILPFITDTFRKTIADSYLKYSYENHTVSATNITYTYSNQVPGQNTRAIYLRLLGESAGNILYTANHILYRTPSDDNYHFLGTVFAQYIRSDIEFRFYQPVNTTDRFVYRLFVGGGLPYKNSEALPFEKSYFVGGANSIRAWVARSLGPGSSKDTTNSQIPDQTADMRIESNIEYRFKLFSMVEGAMFIDAGNIWTVKDNTLPGSIFEFTRFYKEIAIGTGIGTRFDFSFFVFRIDLGLKIKDPSLPENHRWIPGSGPLTENDFNLTFGIGYPF